MINYLRKLKTVLCNKCNHRGYDAEFEDYKTVKVNEKTNEATIGMICPKCKCADIKYLNQTK